jgi:hypothetical protein
MAFTIKNGMIYLDGKYWSPVATIDGPKLPVTITKSEPTTPTPTTPEAARIAAKRVLREFH